jgi:very-short-patch-repair endonuclease
MLSFLNALSPLIVRSVPIDIPKKEMVFDKKNKGKQVKSNKFTGISKLERRIKVLLERHYGVEFNNVRLSFMKNPKTGRLLEMDIYNEQLKLAIEVDGVFHRSSASHFYKEKEGKSIDQQFQDQLFRDQLKARLCKEHGIKLIVIHDNEIDQHMMDDQVLNFVLQRIALSL